MNQVITQGFNQPTAPAPKIAFVKAMLSEKSPPAGQIERDGTGILCQATLIFSVYLVHARAVASANHATDPTGELFGAMCSAAMPLLQALDMTLSQCRQIWELPEFKFSHLVAK